MSNFDAPPSGADSLQLRLVWARSRKGWKQRDLAVAAGVSVSTVGMIESGARTNKGSLPEIAEALGVEYKWLASGEGKWGKPSHEDIDGAGVIQSTGQADLKGANDIWKATEAFIAAFPPVGTTINSDVRNAALSKFVSLLSSEQ